jgi:hypothetical protein
MKLKAHKTIWVDGPQIWLRDENYRLVAQLGAWNNETNQTQASTICAAVNAIGNPIEQMGLACSVALTDCTDDAEREKLERIASLLVEIMKRRTK